MHPTGSSYSRYAAAARLRAPARWSSIDVAACASLIIAGVVLPLVLAAMSGSLDIAHNDDFSYRRIALALFETGRLELIGWSLSSLIGQILAVQPLLWLSGGQPWAFAATTALLASAGIASAYYLMRRILPTSLAALATLSLVTLPGVLAYTTTFMTDVPALAAELVCLALAAAAHERRGRGQALLLVASLAAGCFAFSIREFGLAAPVAVLVSFGARPLRRRAGFIVLAAATLGVCLAVWLVVQSLPGPHQAQPYLPQLGYFGYTKYAVPVVALAISPALVLGGVGGWQRWRKLDFTLGAVLGIVLYREELWKIWLTRAVPRILVGNVLEPEGLPGGVSAGSRPIVLGPPVWDILELVGLISVFIGLGILVASLGAWRRDGSISLDRLRRSLSSTEGLLAAFVLLYAGGLIGFGLGELTYDRYTWPLVLPLSGLLLVNCRFRIRAARMAVADVAARVSSALLVVLLAGTTVALLLNALAFDAAGWRMGRLAVSFGYDARTVDAGMAWVGSQAIGAARPNPSPSSSETWYDALWTSFRPCAMVGSSQFLMPGFALVSVDPDAYRLYLFSGDQQAMYLYRIDTPGCP
jgi:hypothetical protein